MIAPVLMDNLIKVLINLILATAAVIIVKRDIVSLISTYSVQSFLLVVLAMLLYLESGSILLIYLAVLTLVSKVLIIPHFMKSTQKS